MLKERIIVGKAYANERARILREVTEELDEQRVKFQAFDLGTGRLLPSRHRTCTRRDMAAWAEREARPEESVRAHPFESAALSTPDTQQNAHGMRIEAAKAALETPAAPHAYPQLK